MWSKSHLKQFEKIVLFCCLPQPRWSIFVCLKLSPSLSRYRRAGIGSCGWTASACAQFSCPFLNLQRKRMCLDQVNLTNLTKYICNSYPTVPNKKRSQNPLQQPPLSITAMIVKIQQEHWHYRLIRSQRSLEPFTKPPQHLPTKLCFKENNSLNPPSPTTYKPAHNARFQPFLPPKTNQSFTHCQHHKQFSDVSTSQNLTKDICNSYPTVLNKKAILKAPPTATCVHYVQDHL
jgi:hypothetical protein